MRQPLIKYITSIIFLVAFLLPRVIDLHALEHLSEHDDEPISCELCDISSHTQQLDLYFGDTSYIEKELSYIPNSYIAYHFYNSPLAKIVSPTTVYNKPPPIMLG